MSFLDKFFGGGNVSNPLTANLDTAGFYLKNLPTSVDPGDAVRHDELGISRNDAWWNTSSSDAGERIGSGAVLSGNFDAELNRVNLWDGNAVDNEATLPELGAGDHNRIVALLEASGSSSKQLLVLAKGTNKINAGQLQNASSIVVRGAGGFVAFRYNENLDKWVMISGGAATDGAGVRSVVYRSDVECTFSFSSSPQNDATTDGFDEASLVLINSSVSMLELTGFSSANRANPNFCPFKRIINVNAGPIVFTFGDGRSTSTNQLTPDDLNDRCVLAPLEWLEIWLAPLLGAGWQVFVPNRQGRVLRNVVTGTQSPEYDGEIVQCADGATINPPTPFWSGQKFGVQAVEGGLILVDPDGLTVENPFTGEIGSDPFYLCGAGMLAHWTCEINRGWIADFPTPPTIVVKNTQGSTVTKGQCVRVTSGGTGAVPAVILARANTAGGAIWTGIVVNDITNNANGAVQLWRVAKIPSALQSGETWVAGDDIYVSTATAGSYTHTKPAGAGTFISRVGTCLSAPGGGNAYVLLEKGPVTPV